MRILKTTPKQKRTWDRDGCGETLRSGWEGEDGVFSNCGFLDVPILKDLRVSRNTSDHIQLRAPRSIRVPTRIKALINVC